MSIEQAEKDLNLAAAKCHANYSLYEAQVWINKYAVKLLEIAKAAEALHALFAYDQDPLLDEVFSAQDRLNIALKDLKGPDRYRRLPDN